MQILKVVLLAIAIILFPLLTFFLIRVALKLARTVDHLNRTLDDARPHFIVFLSNLNRAVEEVNLELDHVIQMTGEAGEMLRSADTGLRSVEEALRSPLARLGGVLAGFATTTFLFRGLRRRLSGEDGS